MWPPPCYFRTRIATVRDRRRRKSQVDDEQEVKFKSMTWSKHSPTPGGYHYGYVETDQTIETEFVSIFWLWKQFVRYSLTFVAEDSFKGQSSAITDWPLKYFQIGWNCILYYFFCILYFYTWSVERHLPLFWHGEDWAHRSIVLVLTPWIKMSQFNKLV